MAFILQRTLQLDKFPGWEGCYITITEPDLAEVEKLSKLDPQSDTKESLTIMKGIISKHLVEGKGWDGKNQVAITVENISDLPISIYTAIIAFLVPNSSSPETN